MQKSQHHSQLSNAPHTTNHPKHYTRMGLAAAGIISLVTGCKSAIPVNSAVNAQAMPSPLPTMTPAPTTTPVPTVTPWASPTPTATPWPSPTPWPTVTPWSNPAAWTPPQHTLPTLVPIPVVPIQTVAGISSNGLIPVSYSPPDGVDVFGRAILRWDYYGELAADEFFDIKIKPAGSNDSVFVDWTKAREYELRPWSGWQAGLYTWQIGIVKGHLEGETKQFIADTGRDSQAFVIKWQAAGHNGGGGGGGGNGSSGGGGSSGGS